MGNLRDPCGSFENPEVLSFIKARLHLPFTQYQRAQTRPISSENGSAWLPSSLHSISDLKESRFLLRRLKGINKKHTPFISLYLYLSYIWILPRTSSLSKPTYSQRLKHSAPKCTILNNVYPIHNMLK